MAAARLATALLCVARAAAIAHRGELHPKRQLATRDVDEASVLQRMQYWEEQHAALPSTGKYLLFTTDAGGLNNIRIGWELTGVVARRTGRTLVLPPKTPMYLLDFGPRNQAIVGNHMNWTGSTLVEDLINLKQLKGMLPTLTAQEFEAEVGTTWDDAVATSEIATHTSADPSACHFEDWERVTDKFLFMDGETKREGFWCGEWFLRGGPREELRRDMDEADWALLRHGFVWHGDAFEIAAKAIRYLGLFEYVAAHARYGDFAETQAQRSADDIYSNWKTLIDNATAIYVATDRQGRFAGFGERHHVNIVMWPDLTRGVLAETRKQYSPERWFKLTGLVEELICTYSKVFIGTDRSSFSGHIERMRLHADTPVRMHLVHTNGDPLVQGESASARQVRVPMDAITEQIRDWESRPWQPAARSRGDEFLQKPVRGLLLHSVAPAVQTTIETA